jgi:hypothetical protein
VVRASNLHPRIQPGRLHHKRISDWRQALSWGRMRPPRGVIPLRAIQEGRITPAAR